MKAKKTTMTKQQVFNMYLCGHVDPPEPSFRKEDNCKIDVKIPRFCDKCKAPLGEYKQERRRDAEERERQKKEAKLDKARKDEDMEMRQKRNDRVDREWKRREMQHWIQESEKVD
jgi:hypothetical protein